MEIVTTPGVYHDGWMDLSGDGSGARVDGAFLNDFLAYWDKIYRPVTIMSVVIFSVVCVLGVLGNGVVIWATTGFRMKKTVSSAWYLNLAVADFLATAFLPVRITQRALNLHWPFGQFMCMVDGFLFHVNMYASIYTLAVIGVDRCVCVVCPVWTRNHRTVGRASRVRLGVWVLALALSTPHFIFRETRSNTFHDNDLTLCYDYFPSTFRWRAIAVANFVAGFVVPFSVIVSCYSVIICRLRTIRPSQASQSGRSFKIIATVIAAFFLCWLPFHVIQLIYALNYPFLDSDTLARVVFFGVPISVALALVNSCVNPLLYVFSQGFRDVLRRGSIVKVLEKAFAEETPPTHLAVTRKETALYQTLV